MTRPVFGIILSCESALDCFVALAPPNDNQHVIGRPSGRGNPDLLVEVPIYQREGFG